MKAKYFFIIGLIIGLIFNLFGYKNETAYNFGLFLGKKAKEVIIYFFS